MQTKYGTSAGSVSAVEMVREHEPRLQPVRHERQRWMIGSTPIAFGDIVLCLCAIVGTLVAVADAWSAHT